MRTLSINKTRAIMMPECMPIYYSTHKKICGTFSVPFFSGRRFSNVLILSRNLEHFKCSIQCIFK